MWFPDSYVSFGSIFLYFYTKTASCSSIIFFTSSILFFVASEICSNENLLLYMFIIKYIRFFAVTSAVTSAVTLSTIPWLKLHIVSTSFLKSLLRGILYSFSIISSFSFSLNLSDNKAPIRRCNSYFP